MFTSARVRLGFLWGFYSAPYIAMLAFAILYRYSVRSLLALLATAILLTLLLAGCARSWRRLFLWYTPLLLASIAYAAYTFSYQVVPGRTLGLLIISASWEEIRGLFVLWPEKWLLLPLLAALAAYLWLARSLPNRPIFVGRTNLVARVLLLVSLPLTAYAATNAAQLLDGIGLNPAVGSIMFFAGQLPRARAEVRGADIVKVPYHGTRDEREEEVHVLIVGESARRGDWGVYGYPRPTTPYLQRIRAEVFLLGNAWSDANLTSVAVPLILTGITPRAFVDTRPHGNLIDLAKEAGYRTTWLVNQDLNVSMSIAITPDRLEFPPEMTLGMYGRHTRDEALLPYYRAELARSGHARFIGMHIMESHWEYYLRYPARFQRFGADAALNSKSLFARSQTSNQQMVDAYDNSVLYGDWFLEQVIEAARALAVPATVTFVPDHGESLALYDHNNAGHGSAQYDVEQFEIPAFVWVNAAYRAAHPATVAALAGNVDKEIHSHDFFFAAADLMGIRWPGFRPELSFASPQFVSDYAREIVVGGVLRTRPQQSFGAPQANNY